MTINSNLPVYQRKKLELAVLAVKKNILSNQSTNRAKSTLLRQWPPLPLHILISGSGIASSVLAFWLLRADPNTTITIVERSPSPRLTGASVDIRSSAVDIIRWMGLESEILAHVTHEAGMQVVDADGAAVATMLATGDANVQSMTSEFEIHRGQLAEILLGPVRDRVKIVYDEMVGSYEQRDDGVLVTFASRKEVEKYDVLVAADGLLSKIRGMMLGTEPREQLYGDGVHVAYFTIKKDLLDGGRLAKGINAPGGRAMYLRPDPDPAGRTRGMLLIVTASDDNNRKKRLNEALRESNESYMKLMEDMYQDVRWLGPEVLKGMRESEDFYCSIFGQTRAPRLHNNRVVLLGDAGYATPGFGTSLAIIGGYVLAGEILTHPGDIETALERYEEILLPFAKGEQGGDFAMQLFNPQTSWGIRIRNTILSWVTWTRLDRLALTMASKLGVTEKKAPMPDYAWPLG